MTPELESLNSALQTKVGDVLSAVSALTEDELNRAPSVPGANSCFVIATHVFGNMRASVLGIAGGLDLRRDRSLEFVASGSLADLQFAGKTVSTDINSALLAFDPSTLDERLLPSQELWGDGTPREESRREALLHPIEHAGIHLGQILLTVDILVHSRANSV
ncbi:MAG: hypothetical protein ABI939_09545 [Anaerolineaceae bacterium]